MLRLLAFAFVLHSTLVIGQRDLLGYEDSGKLLTPEDKKFEYKDGEYTFGTASLSDRRLYDTEVTAFMVPMVKVHKKLVVSVQDKKPGFIYNINVRDVSSKRTGGSVSIIQGGIGCRYVTLSFESEKGKGMHFFVSIYGH